MKAISLIQPWASLWLAGPKIHETRAYRTSYRGWLLVHASKTLLRPSPTVAAICARQFGKEWWTELPRGALLGAVYLVDCEPTGMARKHVAFEDLECGDYTPGRWAWRRAFAAYKFPEPVPLRGMVGVFDVDNEQLPISTFEVAV